MTGPGPAARGRSAISLRWIEAVDATGAPTRVSSRRDALATEEPLEIRVQHGGVTASVAVTMRTPGADLALAAGFLFTEGLLESPGEVVSIRHCRGRATIGPHSFSSVDVVLSSAARFDAWSARRSFFATSSCGVCGKRSVEEVVAAVRGGPANGPLIPAGLLVRLPMIARERQRVFTRTGGLHATALFDHGGELIALHEDVGRHNALDKVVGEAWLAGRTPMDGKIALLSGRISFEVVQKAARAGIPILAGISAPSSLAAELAERLGITLIGFLREGRFNIYSGRERIADLPARVRRRD